ncbi:hypothetical protein [Geopseudomonas aromaticivorans]
MKSTINTANPYLHDLIEGLREPGLEALHFEEQVHSDPQGYYKTHISAELTLQANKARTGRELHLALSLYQGDLSNPHAPTALTGAPAARTYREVIDPNSPHAVTRFRSDAQRLGASEESIKAFESTFELMLEACRQCGGTIADTNDRRFKYEEPYEEVPGTDGKPGYGAYAHWSNYDMWREIVKENVHVTTFDQYSGHFAQDEIEIQVHGPQDKRYFYADLIAQPNQDKTALECWLAVSHRSGDVEGPIPNCREIVLISPRSETLLEDFRAATQKLGITPSFAAAYEGRFARLAHAAINAGFEMGDVSVPHWDPHTARGYEHAAFRERVLELCGAEPTDDAYRKAGEDWQAEEDYARLAALAVEQGLIQPAPEPEQWAPSPGM